MADANKIELVNEYREHAREIKFIRQRIHEIESGAASATMSTGDGSKSYTNHSIAEFRREIGGHVERMNEIRRLLDKKPARGPRHVEIIRS